MSDSKQTYVLDSFKLCAIALYGETIVVMGTAMAAGSVASRYSDTFVSCAVAVAVAGGVFAMVDRPMWRYVEKMHDLHSKY